MAFGSTFANDELKLIYNGVAIANIADNAGTSPLTSLYVRLHTAAPTGGDQSSNEATYTGYAAKATARTTSDWTVTGNSVSPAAVIEFPEATAGSETITHFSVGVAASGVSKIIDYGTVSPTIAVANGVMPQLKVTSTITRT